LKTSFSCLSDDIVRFKIEKGVSGEMYKNVNTVSDHPMDFLHTPEQAVIICDVIIVGRRLLHV